VATALAVGSGVAFSGLSSSRVFGAVGVTAPLGLPAAHMIRRRLSKPTAASASFVTEDTGNLVRVESTSAEGLRVAYRGSVWQGRLIKEHGKAPVKPGDVLQIASREGNDLLLTPVIESRNSET